MGGLVRAVLRPGDWVRLDGGEHPAVAVAGTAVYLRSTTGGQQVVRAGYLMATVEFAMVDAEPAPSVEPFGLLVSGVAGDVVAGQGHAGGVAARGHASSASRVDAPMDVKRRVQDRLR